jgi:perosamine synthetase
MASRPRAQADAAFIPLSVPALGGNEWRYVKECLDTNWVSSVGPFVTRFERMMAERIGLAAAVATVNGTAALHLALRVVGVERDDEVILPALTFIAPANAVRYVGAWPVFLDVDRETGQLDPQLLADFVARDCEWVDGSLKNKHSGRRVKAVLPVDILGHPADLDAIVEIARSRELLVVEDATESLGARYKGDPVGDRADVSCFSFNGNKIVTTGGGGMLVTDRQDWSERARHLSTQAKSDAIEYIHDEIGFNYRLTNVLAAIGVAQLERLDDYVGAKRRIAQTYTAAFAAVPGVSPMAEASWAFSTWWLYTARIDANAYGMNSREVIRRLGESGIEARPLWEPLHRSAVHRQAYASPAPAAEALYQEAVSLPSSVALSAVDQHRVIEALRPS